MRRLLIAVMVLGGCGGKAADSGPDNEAGATFPTPWEDAVPGNKKIAGEFLAEIDGEQPGTGWFTSGPTEGRDAVQATVLDAGATWPVVQIRILGHTPDGWNTLELDVALNRWVAGTIPLDGDSAVGVLTDADDGEVWYLLHGDLEITQPGLEPGELVQGSFSKVFLSEPM